MFKTLESFQRQLYKVVAKLETAQDAVDQALLARADAKLAIYNKADAIRAEADAMLRRANQINTMVEKITKNADLQ